MLLFVMQQNELAYWGAYWLVESALSWTGFWREWAKFL